MSLHIIDLRAISTGRIGEFKALTSIPLSSLTPTPWAITVERHEQKDEILGSEDLNTLCA